MMTSKIVIDGLHSGSLNRLHDQFLMDEWDNQGLSITLLQQLNICRMYLRVSKLSDITTNNGLYIQEGYLDGTRINPYTTNEWPRQLLPSRQAWKVWNHHIKKTFYNGSTLRQPLGSWLTDLPQAHTRFLPTTQQLVQIKQHSIFVASTTMNRKTIMHHANWTQQLSIDESNPL